MDKLKCPRLMPQIVVRSHICIFVIDRMVRYFANKFVILDDIYTYNIPKESLFGAY